MTGRPTIVAIVLAVVSAAGLAQERPDTYGGGEVDRDLRSPMSRATRSSQMMDAGVDPGTWYKVHVVRDLKSLLKLSRELVSALEAPRPAAPQPPAVQRALSDRAGKIAKLSRNTWDNVQERQSPRPKPPIRATGAARRQAEALADARTLHGLVVEVADEIATDERSRQVDAKRRLATIEKLERINALALQIQLDVAR